MLSDSVFYRPGNPYPVGRWFLLWMMCALLFLAFAISAHLLFAPYSFLITPIAYLFTGWRLNRLIYDSLHIDPYQGAVTVTAVLDTKKRMILGWWHRWPCFLAKLWFVQIM